MIRVENLSKKYGKMTAVHSLNFDVRKGTVFGFVGENGAGKTTTLSILATLMLPSSGRAYINEVEVTTEPGLVRRQIGFLPDEFGVYDDLTVREYLAFYGTAYGVESHQIDARAAELLHLVNLEDRSEVLVNSLSRGMKQRLGLARSLMHDPPVLILDEPASGLDPRSRIEMREIIKGLRERGKTVLISSHILPELADMCDEIGIIQHGTLVACASVEVMNARVSGKRHFLLEVLSEGHRLAELLARESKITEILKADEDKVEFIYAGSEADQVELIHELALSGFQLKTFQELGGSLEELFLRLTADEEAKAVPITNMA